ncbi:MAG: alanine--tRNA ligase [Pyrinomonadaceae bacterium]|nr:alanine--tRNA ligase [Pyrinomonadaceae bacterium]
MAVYDEMTESQQFAARVIADHARATTFAIADGILPGNEGRNYVLRKIMRRAIYHGREHLGLNEPFFYKVCDFVVDKMHGAFPELETQRDFIGKMVRLEEDRFGNTVTVGLGKLNDLGISSSTPADDDLFMSTAKLYDTFGTPRDLIRVYLEEKGLAFEEEDFNERFDNALQALQRQTGIGKTERKSEVSPVYTAVSERIGGNSFLGYDCTKVVDATVQGILKDGVEVNTLSTGEDGAVILDITPFYAESGGQVGDVGVMTGLDKSAVVTDTYSPVTGLIVHKVRVRVGSISVRDLIDVEVDMPTRDATRRNHTATHLVHAALKEVLGTHVKQAGSVVAPNYLRFDFTHYQPVTDGELAEVEDIVNRYILQNAPVTTDMMALEDAMRSGAVAMFGEKYGGEVRVLSVGDGQFSKELCGGTHVRATGDIGSFKITSDEAIASGVRRIRAITGFDAFERFREDEVLIDRSLAALKTQRNNLPDAIARLQEDLRRTRREMDDLKLKIALNSGQGSVAGAQGDEPRDIDGIKVLAKIVEGLDANGTRQLSDTLLARLKSGVVVLGRIDEGKVGIIVRVSADLTSKVKAGDIIREIAPIVGGRGGGKPDMAEGGGTEPAKLADAIDAAYGFVEKALS